MKTHPVDILVWGESSRVPEIASVAREALEGTDLDIVGCRVVPPEPALWTESLRRACSGGARCILVVGGGGFAPGECLPDLVESMVERAVPGIPEAIREAGRELDALAPLFRGVAGLTRGGILLVMVPGERAWLAATLSVLKGVLPHALDKAGGDMSDCGHV